MGIDIEDIFVQPLKALVLIVVTLFGIVNVKREVQFSNAFDPIVVTVLGIVKGVSKVQSVNAPVPIVNKVGANVRVVNVVRPRNALFPMDVNPLSITTCVTLERFAAVVL